MATIGEAFRLSVDVSGEDNYGILSLLQYEIRSFNPSGIVLDSLSVPYCLTITVDQSHCYVCKGGRGFKVESCSNPQNLYQVADLPDSGLVAMRASLGDYLYVATNEGGVAIMDLSNPWEPILVNRFPTGGKTMTTMISPDSNYLYVTDFTQGISIYELADPGNPVLLNTVSQSPDTGAGGLFYKNGYPYLSLWNGYLHLYDLSDQSLPVLLNRMFISIYFAGVEFSPDGSYLFAICGVDELKIYQIIAPDSIVYSYTLTMF